MKFSGAVVASRLSEVQDWKVLLLEAGGDETDISDIPLLAAYVQLSELDWKYKTEPQGTYCQGTQYYLLHLNRLNNLIMLVAMRNGRCNWPRGKVLGGSSVLNYMLYLRGNRRDYDHWEALGNPGWGYENVLHYFKKSEDNLNPYLAKTEYHGTGGYLTVGESSYHTPLTEAFILGGQELGYENRDINGKYQTGFMVAQGTIRNGARCSTSKAFLQPAIDRENLDIAMKAHVTKVLIDPIKKVAYGVEFWRDNRIHRVRAR